MNAKDIVDYTAAIDAVIEAAEGKIDEKHIRVLHGLRTVFGLLGLFRSGLR